MPVCFGCQVRRLLLDSSLKTGSVVRRCFWIQSPTTVTAPSVSDLEHRYPGGKKVTQYRRAKLERFGLYLQPDGLLTRLTTYKDQSCECPPVQQKHQEVLSAACLTFVPPGEGTEVELVKEWYQGRNDHLEHREFNQVLRVTTEHFQPGRRFHLLRKSTSCGRSVRT